MTTNSVEDECKEDKYHTELKPVYVMRCEKDVIMLLDKIVIGGTRLGFRTGMLTTLEAHHTMSLG